MLKTLHLPCTVVVCVGEGGKQGIAGLLVTGCGIAVFEIFRAIRVDSQCCV